MIELTGDPNIEVLDKLQAKRLAETLHRHYPGHLWAVTCERRTGIATVRNLRLSGNWGFVLKLDDLKHDSEDRLVMQAGGELLERYRVTRGRYNSSMMETELVADHG